MTEDQLARPFQLHLFDGRILHGVQFPTGHVAVEDVDRGEVISSLALGALLHDGYNGVVLWPEDLAKAERSETLQVLSEAELHARQAHPDFEYATTEGPRKQWDDADVPPCDEEGLPDRSWERNVHAGRDGWERWDYTEESYWHRRKPQ